MKTFFFVCGDHLKIRRKVCHFPCLFWTAQSQRCVIFELSPGPPSALGAPKQECSRPRKRTKDTSTNALQTKTKKGLFSGDLQEKKRYSQNFFRRSPEINVFQKFFQALHKILTIQKIVLSSSRGQANF